MKSWWLLAPVLCLAALSLGLSWLWYFGVSWSLLSKGALILLGAGVAYWLVLAWQQRGYARQVPESLRNVFALFLSAQVPSWLVPTAVFSLPVLFSGVLISSWWLFSFPVSWDNVSLYEYRAFALAGGASVQHLLDMHRQSLTLRGYDFFHPFGSSVLTALFLPFTNHASFWLLLLLGGAVLVWMAGLFRAKSWFLLSVLLVFAQRTMLQTLTEGYAVVWSLWWWVGIVGLSWQWWQAHIDQQENIVGLSSRRLLLCIGLLLAATLNIRTAEPWWVLWPIFLTSGLLWQVRRNLFTLWKDVFFTLVLLWMLPVLSWCLWWWLKHTIGLDLAQTPLRDLPSEFLSQGYVANRWARLLSVDFVLDWGTALWEQRTLFAHVVPLVFALWLARQRKTLVVWTLAVLSGFVALAAGMGWWVLVNPETWREFFGALYRSSLPLWVVSGFTVGLVLDDYFFATAKTLQPSSKYRTLGARKPARKRNSRTSLQVK